MNPSGQTLQSPSFLWLEQASNQHPMRSVLQSCLECLDSLEDPMHEETKEICNLLVGLLNNFQPDVTMADSGGYNGTVDSQAGFDELNTMTTYGSSHDSSFMSQPVLHRTSLEVTESLSEDTYPLHGKFAVCTTFPLTLTCLSRPPQLHPLWAPCSIFLHSAPVQHVRQPAYYGVLV